MILERSDLQLQDVTSKQMQLNAVNSAKALYEVSQHMAKRNIRENQAFEATVELPKIQRIQLEMLEQLNVKQTLAEQSAIKRDCENSRLNNNIFYVTFISLLVTMANLLIAVVTFYAK